jgi:hypothetical protein
MQTIDSRYLPICKACRWYDLTTAQCYDGHLQYNGRLKCEGFECPPHRSVTTIKRSKTAFKHSDDKI